MVLSKNYEYVRIFPKVILEELPYYTVILSLIYLTYLWVR